MEKLRHEVLNLDQRTIAEMKSLASPPQQIKIVMGAVLLLLGSDKEVTKVSTIPLYHSILLFVCIISVNLSASDRALS